MWPLLCLFSERKKKRNRVHEFINKAMTGLLGPEEVEASEKRFGNNQIQQLFYNQATSPNCGR